METSSYVGPTAGCAGLVVEMSRSAVGARVVHAEGPLDGHHVPRAREGGWRGLPWMPRPANGLKEPLEPGRRDDPQHDEIVGPFVDQFVGDVVAEEAGGAGHQRVAGSTYHDPATAPEADLELDLVAVRVLPHPASRRDGLVTHREPVE